MSTQDMRKLLDVLLEQEQASDFYSKLPSEAINGLNIISKVAQNADQELDEGKFTNAVATAALALAGLVGSVANAGDLSNLSAQDGKVLAQCSAVMTAANKVMNLDNGKRDDPNLIKAAERMYGSAEKLIGENTTDTAFKGVINKYARIGNSGDYAGMNAAILKDVQTCNSLVSQISQKDNQSSQQTQAVIQLANGVNSNQALDEMRGTLVNTLGQLKGYMDSGRLTQSQNSQIQELLGKYSARIKDFPDEFNQGLKIAKMGNPENANMKLTVSIPRQTTNLEKLKTAVSQNDARTARAVYNEYLSH